jgi:hypothetical protein
MTRFWSGLSLVALVALVPGALVGCGTMDLGPVAPDAACDDAACLPPPITFDDGGVDFGTRDPSGGEGLETGALVTDASPEALATCYDGLDNNTDGLFDCTDPGCAQLASCCVGANTLACCDAQEPVATMSLDGCSGTVEGCTGLSGLVGFGSPSPLASLDRLFPNGDASGDSGIVLTTSLDGQRALVVSGLLSTPVGDCGDGCFESVALGLIAGDTPGSATTLRPLVAVVASAARREISLVLAGETVARAALSTAREQQVTLVVLPTGAVSLEVFDPVSRELLPPLGGRIPPSAAPLRLAVYGHNLNRSAAARPASYARAVTVATALCDVPSRWLGRTPLGIGTGPAALGSASAPSFTYTGTQTFVAFASEGALVFARANGEDVGSGVALLSANQRYAIPGEVLADPDVHYDSAADGYTVYFANLTRGSIMRLHLASDATPLGAASDWLAPSLDSLNVESFDGPSVLRPPPLTTASTYVFARARMVAGDTRIVRFPLVDEATPFAAPPDWDAVTVRTTQSAFGAFDRDEVASPAAYRLNGTIQVAFSGRSGARWAIGLMSTDDPRVVLWRPAPVASILAGDGGGFDALSVRDPVIVARGGKVELLYTGSDGVTDTLGYAYRSAANRLTGGP